MRRLERLALLRSAGVVWCVEQEQVPGSPRQDFGLHAWKTEEQAWR